MFRVGNVFVSFQCGFCSYFLAILFSAYTGFSSIMAMMFTSIHRLLLLLSAGEWDKLDRLIIRMP